jgi:hypothetical protein
MLCCFNIMRPIIVLLCLVASAAAQYTVLLNYASVQPVTRDYGNELKEAFFDAANVVDDSILANPNIPRNATAVGMIGYETIVVTVEWAPGDGRTSGLHPPHYSIRPSDLDKVWDMTKKMFPYISASVHFKIVDRCNRGGFLRIHFDEDYSSRPSTPGHDEMRKRDELVNLFQIPLGDGKNGTFMKLSKEKYDKTLLNKAEIPYMKLPLSNAKFDQPCPRGDAGWNPMSACIRRGTIIAGKTLSGKMGKPLLQSANGNHIAFNGYGMLMVYVRTPKGSNYNPGLVGEKNENGPHALTLHTNGALCFYDKKSAYFCTAGSTNDGKYMMIMQNDGNLVIYRGRDIKHPIWASNTQRNLKASVPADCNAPRP